MTTCPNAYFNTYITQPVTQLEGVNLKKQKSMQFKKKHNFRSVQDEHNQYICAFQWRKSAWIQIVPINGSGTQKTQVPIEVNWKRHI